MSWQPPEQKKRIGEILIQSGYILPRDLEEALAVQQRKGGLLGKNLIKLGRITRDQLALALAEQYAIPHLEMVEDMVSQELWERIDPEIWVRHQACPVVELEDEIVVVLTEPPSEEVVRSLEEALGVPVQPALGDPQAVRAALRRRTAVLDESESTFSGTIMAGEHPWIWQAVKDGDWGLEVRCDGERIRRIRLRRGAMLSEKLSSSDARAEVRRLLSPLGAEERPDEYSWSGWIHRFVAGRYLRIGVRRLRWGDSDWTRFTWMEEPPRHELPQTQEEWLQEQARRGGLLVASTPTPPETERLLWWLAERLHGDRLHLSMAPAPPDRPVPVIRFDPTRPEEGRNALRTAAGWSSAALVVHEQVLEQTGFCAAVRGALLRDRLVLVGLTAPRPSRLPALLETVDPVGHGIRDAAFAYGAFLPAPNAPGVEPAILCSWPAGEHPRDEEWYQRIHRAREAGHLTPRDAQALLPDQEGARP